MQFSFLPVCICNKWFHNSPIRMGKQKNDSENLRLNSEKNSRVYLPLGAAFICLLDAKVNEWFKKECLLKCCWMSLHISFNIYTVPFRWWREMQFSTAIDAFSWLNWINLTLGAATRFVYGKAHKMMIKGILLMQHHMLTYVDNRKTIFGCLICVVPRRSVCCRGRFAINVKNFYAFFSWFFM